MDAKARFAKRLRSVRERLDISQRQLSKLSGINEGQISHFESGNRSPSLMNFYIIARTLQVSCDYLLGLSPQMTLQREFTPSEMDGLTFANKALAKDIITCIAEHTQRRPHD